ncbi:hypothetical protein SFRURICE_020884 [Spodoptera frugiperda]|uniref:SFRICE_007000 n=1 Tax=Spodoptera frugiperda TaxID=7108 RepID=A0A2H1WAT8_SPOFR|nr:hypothetical protein SFRURICE_020884 [Spodoptera frugiperda]
MAGSNMEAPKSDAPKLPDMVMCGDHPSVTKTELNVKTDGKVDDKDKGKDKSLSYTKITPSISRTERGERGERGDRDGGSGGSSSSARGRATSEHALRLSEARRRVRSLEAVQRPDADLQATGNRALVQAALGSFRWPPYLLCVWVLVLVLTHVLHCLVSLLERALPALRKCSHLFRTWTEECWRGQSAAPGAGGEQRSQRVYPAGLAVVTAILYTLYFTLYACYAVVLWAIEPLCADDDKRSDTEPTVTEYEDEVPGPAPCKPALPVKA